MSRGIIVVDQGALEDEERARIESEVIFFVVVMEPGRRIQVLSWADSCQVHAANDIGEV